MRNDGVECWNCGGRGVIAGCLEDTCSCDGDPDDLEYCCAPRYCDICDGRGGWDKTEPAGLPK